MELKEKFIKKFNCLPTMYFDCGGRFEILGNHTDHNHGLCLAATANLSIKAVVKKIDNSMITFISEGYPNSEIDLSNLNYNSQENKSASMIRGVARFLKDHGYKIGGFIAYCVSDIYPGAGLSSSAAFELLIGKIFNELYNSNSIPTLTLCFAGQYAENNYYGKKSGLLDQIGVAFGEISYIDFKENGNPVVENVTFPFDDLCFVAVNTGGDHSSLNDLYSSIPNDMFNAAKKMGHNFLRECCETEMLSNTKLTLNEKNRSQHFFDENKRVSNIIKSLKNHELDQFLKCINDSRISSTNLLKNMMIENQYLGSPLEACDYAMKFLGNNGACKINGGGFAGSIICILKKDFLSSFLKYMKEKYNDENVIEIQIRKDGPACKKI